MEAPLRQKVAALVRERRDALVQRSLEAVGTEVALGAPPVERTPALDLGKRDMEQMIDGFIALLAEALDGESRDVRRFFLETVIPGLVSSGAPASGIIGGVVEFAILVSVDVTATLPAEERDEAQLWFARFFNGYLAEMVQVASEASK